MSVSFGRKALPTKIELIRIKKSLKVAKVVHKILEDKREVLLRRLDEMIVEATEARQHLWKPLSEAYQALFDAYLKMGAIKLEATASTTPPQIDVNVSVRRIVDVDVPTLQVNEKNAGLSYGFADTSSALDKATRTMRRLLSGICKAAEMENAIFRLAAELERTQRLINALEYIIIPQYQETARLITSTLEEREREEFVKLKHVKTVLEGRKTA